MTEWVPYLDHLPEVFGEIREFDAIGCVADKFIGDAYRAIGNAVDDMFAATSSGESLGHHERILGARALGGESEDDRRRRLAAVYCSPIPCTMAALERKLAELCGDGNYEISLDAPSCVLSVAAACDDGTFGLVSDMVRRFASANLEVRMIRRGM